MYFQNNSRLQRTESNPTKSCCFAASPKALKLKDARLSVDYYENVEKKPVLKPKPKELVPWYEWILIPILVAALVTAFAMWLDPLVNQRRLYPEWFMERPFDDKGGYVWSAINPWVVAAFFIAAFYVATLVGLLIVWSGSMWFVPLIWLGLFLCPPAEPRTNSNLLFIYLAIATALCGMWFTRVRGYNRRTM